MKIELTVAERTRLRQAMKQAASARLCPPLASGAAGQRRDDGGPPRRRHRSEHPQRAILGRHLATIQRTPPPQKALAEQPRLGTTVGLARLGPPAAAGRVGQGPIGAWLRGVELDRAAVGRTPAPTLPPAHQRSHLAPSLAGGGSALEAAPLRLCRTCPARRPEKGRSCGR